MKLEIDLGCEESAMPEPTKNRSGDEYCTLTL